jgi:two-component system response regulator FixJ
MGHQNTTILVVDDDPAVRSALAFSLQVEGFRVRAYRSGSDLLDDAALPDRGCLVIDYKLPDMTGLDLLSELRRRQSVLPAILITTHPSAAVREQAAAFAVQVVEKPLLSETLFDAIRAATALH